MSRRFAVVPPDLRLAWLFPGIGLAAAAIGLLLAMQQTPRAALGLLPIALATALIIVALHRRGLSIDGGELRITAGMNSRRVPVDALQLDRAAVVDLAERTELRPFVRTFGTGLPGLQAGDCRLRNGTKAFVLVTDTRRVLWLPVRDGRALLLSLEQPQALLDALRGGR